ncbi:MAG: HU family DNA-binding protein [Mariprofundaceae bacterium]|nr:HU family DNA-binding protein [Mariprofundaceae bacterium]
MNKADLISYVSKQTSLNKSLSGDAVEAVLDGITNSLKEGEAVNIVGFGAFSVVERAPRKARNPRTGEIVEVPASSAPKFKAGKNLRESIK